MVLFFYFHDDLLLLLLLLFVIFVSQSVVLNLWAFVFSLPLFLSFVYLWSRCYIKLYDSPKSTTAAADEMSRLPPSQRKKLRQKQRKDEARAKKVCLTSIYVSFYVSLWLFVTIFVCLGG